MCVCAHAQLFWREIGMALPSSAFCLSVCTYVEGVSVCSCPSSGMPLCVVPLHGDSPFRGGLCTPDDGDSGGQRLNTYDGGVPLFTNH